MASGWPAEQKAAEHDQKSAQELRDKVRGLARGGGGGHLGDLGSLDGIGFALL